MQTNNIIKLIGIKESKVENVEDLENTIIIESEIRKRLKGVVIVIAKFYILLFMFISLYQNSLS